MTEGLGNPAVRDALLALLDAAGVPYEHRVHRPIAGAEDAAALRGEALAVGGKAMVMRTSKGFQLLAFSAARAMDNRRVRHHLHSSKLRFATPAELFELTGLVPGCVPPFGAPLLPMALHLDRQMLEQPRIAFTPGLRTESILMSVPDFLAVSQPFLGDFSRPLDT